MLFWVKCNILIFYQSVTTILVFLCFASFGIVTLGIYICSCYNEARCLLPFYPAVSCLYLLSPCFLSQPNTIYQQLHLGLGGPWSELIVSVVFSLILILACMLCPSFYYFITPGHLVGGVCVFALLLVPQQYTFLAFLAMPYLSLLHVAAWGHAKCCFCT